ncbi:hypothetical protein I3842_16G074900 [Carya illinoinensis]|uniref:TIR domain-containing protein n=1 Tax=Carya illinoinensis TaxID=32201 RepID=A0A922A7C1_CARIL|nr:hypothetical protein I3842_16G074900 [Carya illinoinensis]
MTSLMAVQGASSSYLSSFTRWRTYDVFLSFRELRKAIESSRISIVILSKSYASSTWCLDELMKILECIKMKQQKVLLVFYDVNPIEVRHQRESFEKALAKFKDRLKNESKVQEWKVALTEVASLSGFTLGDRYTTSTQFIQKIVQEVSRLVKHKYLNDVVKHLVRMESRVQDVYNKLLSVELNDTRILGIYEIGGVDKTSLAKEIYNTFTDHFEDCCFLANVREISKREHGLIQLQENLLYEFLGDSSLKVGNVDEGIGLIKEMLWSKRVSIKVETLLGGCDWFGLGSIIIITTRDQHLLTSNNVNLRYKVKELDHDEALWLFCLNAFKNENLNPDFVELTEDLLHYIGSLPLALMVLGSDLYGRDIHYWRSALEKYKRIPHNDIHEKLRISYDGLEESEKNIFLDIACFFTGEEEEYVTKVLDSSGFFPKCGIKVLVDKSLITIESSRLIMHDLVKDMSREIVCQESPEEPEKRSRFWFHEDICHVFKETKGTNKIQGILIEFPKQDLIYLNPETFSTMRRLRVFINRNARFSREPNYLSNDHSFSQKFHGKKLVVLKMDDCFIKELGDGLKNFQKLTTIKFSKCKFLIRIPDVSVLQTLERLDIEYCNNLVEVHQYIGFLDKLVRLSIQNCHSLTSFPRSLKLRSLETLILSFGKKLQKFSEIESEMKCLRFFKLVHMTTIKELPSSIGNLASLKQLEIICYKPRSAFSHSRTSGDMHDQLDKMESRLNQTNHHPCYQTIVHVEFYSFKFSHSNQTNTSMSVCAHEMLKFHIPLFLN